MKIVVASDHAGFQLKEAVKAFLTSQGYEPVDFGTTSEDSVDYPDYGIPAAEAVARGAGARGVFVCGSGIGMSILANKIPGIRAALCTTVKMAEFSRSHNDANVLVLGERIVDKDSALEIVKVWLSTPFEGGRHKRRIEKITAYEGGQSAYPPSPQSERSVIC
ncbi:MAG: ribose 5-phosphate isomerase B [Gemmatimonadota bacterium]|nr:MAG: ribose 5-phosphate isomerase B [Gemmatimonadota bacterium]